MRILLDECIPHKLKNYLAPHVCRAVSEEGWAGTKNGELLMLAEKAGFQVFLTIDSGIQFQQNLKARHISVMLVRAKSNRFVDLQALVPEILRSLETAQSGQVAKVG
jgi:predicted nuclease of predicted toxin-antitoxin system